MSTEKSRQFKTRAAFASSVFAVNGGPIVVLWQLSGAGWRRCGLCTVTTEPEVGFRLSKVSALLVRLSSEARLPRSAAIAEARQCGETFVYRETTSPVRFLARFGALHVKVSGFLFVTSSSRPCVATRARFVS